MMPLSYATRQLLSLYFSSFVLSIIVSRRVFAQRSRERSSRGTKMFFLAGLMMHYDTTVV